MENKNYRICDQYKQYSVGDAIANINLAFSWIVVICDVWCARCLN